MNEQKIYKRDKLIPFMAGALVTALDSSCAAYRVMQQNHKSLIKESKQALITM